MTDTGGTRRRTARQREQDPEALRETEERRQAIKWMIPTFSRVIANPERTKTEVTALLTKLEKLDIEPNLRERVKKDVVMGALLHGAAMHSLAVEQDAPVSNDSNALYVDNILYKQKLPEPLHALVNTLTHARFIGVRSRFPELYQDSNSPIEDPLLAAAFALPEWMRVMPEELIDLSGKERRQKMLEAMLLDDVTQALRHVVGAEHTTQPHNVSNLRQTILENRSSLLRLAGMETRYREQIWTIQFPAHDESGRLNSIPPISRDSNGTFRFPDMPGGRSLCMGMIPVTESIEAFENRPGGFSAFHELMHVKGNPQPYRLQPDGTVTYRLIDVEVATVCERADPHWQRGELLSSPRTVVLGI